ncbi:hypothetical protein [Rhizobium leguminosarum]|uniref:hypothetical protein n=1 Tax=Rhizobium leguminosarum TaxID=384 RepID=UPI003F95739C
MNKLAVLSEGFPLPAMVEALPESGRLKFLEFFTAQIRNANTGRSYTKTAVEFLRWCDDSGARSLDAITPIHVPGWVEQLTRSHAAPTAQAAPGRRAAPV